MKLLLTITCCFMLFSFTNKEKKAFKKVNTSSEWEMKFSDECTSDWKENWFLDGELATIVHSEDGMDFSAGPINRDDRHHAVLWTNQTFEGDIKIEYDYTRTDSQIVNVNILYIQASGNEKMGFDKDITKWNDYRKVAAMSKYYYGMDPIHISYAAFKMVNDDPNADYIRARKYPAEQDKFKLTGLKPDFYVTGLFKTGQTYHITVIKADGMLHFNVEDEGKQHLFCIPLTPEQMDVAGHIGLRHMYTRSAQYKNFKVYTK